MTSAPRTFERNASQRSRHWRALVRASSTEASPGIVVSESEGLGTGATPALSTMASTLMVLSATAVAVPVGSTATRTSPLPGVMTGEPLMTWRKWLFTIEGVERVGASLEGRRRGLPMMGVLTLPIWKTSTCPTLPSPALT